MSTTGTVINYVFDAINEYDETHGAPLHDIVNVVSQNLANDHVVPKPRDILSHTRRAIDYGLQNGLLTQLSPDIYAISKASCGGMSEEEEDDGDEENVDEPMDDDDDDDYEEYDGNAYDSDDEENEDQGQYPETYYYRRSPNNAYYQEETTDNPYYKNEMINQRKKAQMKRNTNNKSGFLPAQIPACPMGPSDPQEPSSPGEPRPPIEPPPYTGGTNRHNNQRRGTTGGGSNDIFNKIVHGSPDDEMNDDDHDRDFDGDSEDFDNDICSEEFNDFEDDAVDDVGENIDDNVDDDNDDDDDNQDSDDEDEPENYEEANDKAQGLRKAKFHKPSKTDKKGRNLHDKKNKNKHLKKGDSCSTCCSNNSYCSDEPRRKRNMYPRDSNKDDNNKKFRFYDNKRHTAMAIGLPSLNIVKRYDRNVDTLKKRLQFAAGKLSQSTEDCCASDFDMM